MRIKYLLFLPLFFLLSLAFTKNSGAFSHESSHHYFSKANNTLTKDHNSGYLLVISPNEFNQAINLRVHKTVHYAQHMFFVENDFLACLKHYNFFSGNGDNQNFTSQTTLLFPFHTFW